MAFAWIEWEKQTSCRGRYKGLKVKETQWQQDRDSVSGACFIYINEHLDYLCAYVIRSPSAVQVSPTAWVLGLQTRALVRLNDFSRAFVSTKPWAHVV